MPRIRSFSQDLFRFWTSEQLWRQWSKLQLLLHLKVFNCQFWFESDSSTVRWEILNDTILNKKDSPLGLKSFGTRNEVKNFFRRSSRFASKWKCAGDLLIAQAVAFQCNESNALEHSQQSGERAHLLEESGRVWNSSSHKDSNVQNIQILLKLMDKLGQLTYPVTMMLQMNTEYTIRKWMKIPVGTLKSPKF